MTIASSENLGRASNGGLCPVPSDETATYLESGELVHASISNGCRPMKKAHKEKVCDTLSLKYTRHHPLGCIRKL